MIRGIFQLPLFFTSANRNSSVKGIFQSISIVLHKYCESGTKMCNYSISIVGEKDYLEYDSSGFLQTLRTEVAIDEGKATLSVRGQDVDAYLEKYPNKFDISVFDYCKMAIEAIISNNHAIPKTIPFIQRTAPILSSENKIISLPLSSSINVSLKLEQFFYEYLDSQKDDDTMISATLENFRKCIPGYIKYRLKQTFLEFPIFLHRSSVGDKFEYNLQQLEEICCPNDSEFQLVVELIDEKNLLKYKNNTKIKIEPSVMENAIDLITVTISDNVKPFIQTKYSQENKKGRNYSTLSFFWRFHPTEQKLPILYGPLLQQYILQQAGADDDTPENKARSEFVLLLTPFSKNETPQKRILMLSGTPGTGKTHFAKIINEQDSKETHFIRKKQGKDQHLQQGAQPLIDRTKMLASGVLVAWSGSASEFRAMYQGQSEGRLGMLASLAELNSHVVTLLIIDEIENLVQSRDKAASNPNGHAGQTDHILAMIQGINDVPNLMILGMTNRIHDVDDAIISRSYHVPFLRMPINELKKQMIKKGISEGVSDEIAKLYINAVPRQFLDFLGRFSSTLVLGMTKEDQIKLAVKLIIQLYENDQSPPGKLLQYIHYPLKEQNQNQERQISLLSQASIILMTPDLYKPIPNGHFGLSGTAYSTTYIQNHANKLHLFNSKISIAQKPVSFIYKFLVKQGINFAGYVNFETIQKAFQISGNSNSIPSQTFINSMLVDLFAEAQLYSKSNRGACIIIEVDDVVSCYQDWNDTSSSSTAKIISEEELHEKIDALAHSGMVQDEIGFVSGSKNFMLQLNMRNEPSANVSHNNSMVANKYSALQGAAIETSTEHIERGKNSTFKIVSEETFSILTHFARSALDTPQIDSKMHIFFSIKNIELADRFLSSLKNRLSPLVYHNSPLPSIADKKPLKRSPDKIGCSHYLRSVKIRCNICEKFFSCGFCHDEKVKDHKLDTFNVSEMLCMYCGSTQVPSKDCAACKKQLSTYYCDICHLWTDIKEQTVQYLQKIQHESAVNPHGKIVHCNSCGICFHSYLPTQKHFCKDKLLIICAHCKELCVSVIDKAVNIYKCKGPNCTKLIQLHENCLLKNNKCTIINCQNKFEAKKELATRTVLSAK